LPAAATSEFPTSEPVVSSEPLPQAPTPEAGMLLAEDEREVLAMVEDGAQSFQDPALPMLLARVARLPVLDALDFQYGLDRVAYRNLIEQPQRYRARPMRLTVQVVGMSRLQCGKDIVGFERWGNSTAPIWRLDCVDVSALDPLTQPIIVLMTTEPKGLGKPDRTTPTGAAVYTSRRVLLDIACVFYKLYVSHDLQGNVRDYPIVLAWQGEAPKDLPAASTKRGNYSQVLLVVGMLVLTYVFIRMRIRRSQRNGDDAYVYQPRRYEEGIDEAAGSPPDLSSPASGEKKSSHESNSQS
jgi:hypothetical protein